MKHILNFIFGLIFVIIIFCLDICIRIIYLTLNLFWHFKLKNKYILDFSQMFILPKIEDDKITYKKIISKFF